MPSDRPANNWNSRDTGDLFWWQADLAWSTPGPVLLDFQVEVLAALDTFGILRFEQIPRVGYVRDRDGSVADFVRRVVTTEPQRFPRLDERLPPGFLLESTDTGADNEVRTLTLLDHVTADGRTAQTWVADMMDFALGLGLPAAFRYPPVTLQAVTGLEGLPNDDVTVYVSTSTDIWFPWTAPLHRPDARPAHRPLDNRYLARLNATRLNACLHRIAVACRAAGGRWSAAPWWYEGRRPLADARGIDLDAPCPDEL